VLQEPPPKAQVLLVKNTNHGGKTSTTAKAATYPSGTDEKRYNILTFASYEPGVFA
jgi:hypothetical protein